MLEHSCQNIRSRATAKFADVYGPLLVLIIVYL